MVSHLARLSHQVRRDSSSIARGTITGNFKFATATKSSTTKIIFSHYILNFVVTPRNFIIAKLSIRKPGSSSVLIISDLQTRDPFENMLEYGARVFRSAQVNIDNNFNKFMHLMTSR